MKTFIKILFLIVFIFLSYHCVRSTEWKMKYKIESTSYYDKKILKVEILDTIFQNQIDSVMKIDSLTLISLKTKLKNLQLEIGDLRKQPRPTFVDSVKIIHFKTLFDSIREYERETSIVDSRHKHYNEITDVNYYNYIDYKNDIRAYRVSIYNKNGRVSEYIIKQDYTILCPSFMIDPLDSTNDFMFQRPQLNEKNEGRRPPRFERPRKDLPGVVK